MMCGRIVSWFRRRCSASVSSVTTQKTANRQCSGPGRSTTQSFSCNCKQSRAQVCFSCLSLCPPLPPRDNLMPKMTGVEACQWIRQNERTNRETKAKTIIFGLTGNALSEDIASFSNAGCDEVLTKPLSVTKLKTALQHYGFKLADAS
mmetsp:Transcript_27242/g.79389  ORF Transcript_27242/g.79389 Transcript_27242/m.79389 type:complete len:148 (+) Transcript_27242:2544-2987(+)